MEVADSNRSIRILVQDLSQIGEARRLASSFVFDSVKDEQVLGRLAIVVSELATNLVKHASGGEIIVSLLAHSIDVCSVDRGPGILDVAESLRDGFSTSGTSGTGLGAVKRIANEFDLYTQATKGTAIFARLHLEGDPGETTEPNAFSWGGICIPVLPEVVCGDGWEIKQQGKVFSILLCDGLGHGPLAHDVAKKASQSFLSQSSFEPVEQLPLLHAALQSSRGAAISLLKIDFEKKLINFAGIGNVQGMISSQGAERRMVCHNGIVGLQMRKVQDFTYPLSDPNTLCILHSDGITTHWDLRTYPGLDQKHPALICAVIVRDFVRGRDDATVVAFRQARS